MSQIKNLYSSTDKASKGVLFGIGNPLLDISADTGVEFLTKYELDADSQILADPEKHKNLYTDLVDNFKVDYLPGGATMNTIRGFQWSLQNKKEAEGASTISGCVGANDNYLKSLKEATDKAGVATKFVENQKGLPTGTCAVAITKNGKARSLVANLSAANEFQEDDISKEEVWNSIEQSRYYYTAGFFLTTVGGPKALEKIGKHCVAKDKTYITNLSAPFISMFFKDQLTTSLSFTDIVFCNETEACTWAEHFGFKDLAEKKDLKSIAKKLSAFESKRNRPRLAIITNGSEPTIVAQEETVEEFKIIKLADDQIVDTNGAGDAFVAGFIAGLVYGKEIEECVKCGNYVASEIIQQAGATFPEVSKLEL